MKSRWLSGVAFVLIVSAAPPAAHAFPHSWSKGFGSGNCADVAVDNAGNIIVVGEYFYQIDFGGGPLPIPDLYGDLFIAKFNPAGTHIWSRNIGGFDSQLGGFVLADNAGNIVIAGDFLDEIDFDGTHHDAVGTVDMYVARLGQDGSRIWSRTFGRASNSSGVRGLALDDAGNVYLLAWGGGNDYGGGPMPTDSDVHIIKLDPDGNHVWSYGFGHNYPNLARPHAIAVDYAGNVIVTGDYDGTIDFGGPTLTSIGGDDVFLVKFNSSGAHLWSQGFGDAGDHGAQRIAVDDAGNIFYAGDIDGSVNFGGGVLTSVGQQDVVLARFDPNGNHMWSGRFGDALSQICHAAALTPSGNVCFAGENSGTLNLGGAALSNGGYLGRFTSGGSHLASDDYGNTFAPLAVAVDACGNLVMAGEKTAATDFGGGPVAQIGSVDVFLARFAPATTGIRDQSPRRALALQAFPNPFNPTTRITYTVPEEGPMSVRVFDPTGRLVSTLVDATRHAPGTHSVDYHAEGASGVYFVRLEALGTTQVLKIVLVK